MTPELLRDLYAQLEQALEREQQALIHRSLDELVTVIEEKHQLTEQLSQAQAQLLPEIEPTEQALAERDPVHTELRELAERCQELNLVNGRLVQRSRHCAQELLRLVQGAPSGSLYGADGTTAPDATSSALALA